jgi:hypothetical protein
LEKKPDGMFHPGGSEPFKCKKMGIRENGKLTGKTFTLQVRNI